MINKFGIVKSYDLSNNKDITSTTIDSYKSDGVICLRNVVSEHWLKIIEDGISEFLKSKIVDGDPSSVAVKHEGDKGSFYYGTLMWKEIEYFRSIIFLSSPLALLLNSLFFLSCLDTYNLSGDEEQSTSARFDCKYLNASI